jgi:hypothetical protein
MEYQKLLIYNIISLVGQFWMVVYWLVYFLALDISGRIIQGSLELMVDLLS